MHHNHFLIYKQRLIVHAYLANYYLWYCYQLAEGPFASSKKKLCIGKSQVPYCEQVLTFDFQQPQL
jgi:hypothetical protein